MSDSTLLRKYQLEQSLRHEKKLIADGILREDNPLDRSKIFEDFCMACRVGDMKTCQDMIGGGRVNINARDEFDYTPLILASHCGHYEVVELLLEAGALCERDTFAGERCLYNALNDRIRNLLLSYDYSKTTDPVQPLAAHLSALLTRTHPRTTDIALTRGDDTFHLHKFLLAARSPYFKRKLRANPDTSTAKVPPRIPFEACAIVLRYLYLGELPHELGVGTRDNSNDDDGVTDSDLLAAIDRLTRHLEIASISALILEGSDRRLARQRRADAMALGQKQMEVWFEENVLGQAVEIDARRVGDVKWDRGNAVFADVLLRADEDDEDEDEDKEGFKEGFAGDRSSGPSSPSTPDPPSSSTILGLPLTAPNNLPSASRCTLFPTHRALLTRSPYFLTMFSSPFREAQETPHLQIIRVTGCPPAVLAVVLRYLYTEKAEAIPLPLAVDVLFAADMLFIDKLKHKAALAIGTGGNAVISALQRQERQHSAREKWTTGATNSGLDAVSDIDRDIPEILRAAYLTRTQRLETFAARYIAYRLEFFIDTPVFLGLVRESAERIQGRQETDTLELVDDVRWFLSERFRMRFEDVGLERAMGEGVDDDHEDEDGAMGVKILEGEEVDDEDEFARDAFEYQRLLAKIEAVLNQLKLDA